jgi:hypothetical protein
MNGITAAKSDLWFASHKNREFSTTHHTSYHAILFQNVTSDGEEDLILPENKKKAMLIRG